MSDTSAEDSLNLFPRVTCGSHRLPSEGSREMTVRVHSTLVLLSGKRREGKTDSEGRDYSSKESALSLKGHRGLKETLILRIPRNYISTSLATLSICAWVNIYLDQCLLSLGQYLLAFLVEELHCYGK